MAAANAAIVHQLPGRIRLRVHEKRGDTGYFSMLSEQVSHLRGVDHVKVNPSTGSIVIEFSGTAENLIQQLQFHHLSVENQYKANNADHRPAKPLPGNGSAAGDTPFHIVSNRDVNPMFMLGTLLAVVGIVQTARGKILVPSLSVLWYAMEAFRKSRVSHAVTDGATRH